MFAYQYQYIRAKFLSIPLVRRILKIKDEVRKVDNVLTAFNAAVADLEQVAVQHAGIAVAHAREIEQRTAAKLAAEAESLKATNIAAKMKAVFQ
jgi:predicted secreted Zn-dependent protease